MLFYNRMNCTLTIHKSSNTFFFRSKFKACNAKYSMSFTISFCTKFYCILPAMGAPMKDAIPWQSTTRPKEEVSFSVPRRSATITGLRVVNTAVRNYTLTKILNWTNKHSCSVIKKSCLLICDRLIVWLRQNTYGLFLWKVFTVWTVRGIIRLRNNNNFVASSEKVLSNRSKQCISDHPERA